MPVAAKPMARGSSVPIKPVTEGVPKWLGKDVFIYRDLFPPPYEHPPHPRQMTMPYSIMAQLRNFHWRLYWETSYGFRYGVYFAVPIALSVMFKFWVAARFNKESWKGWQGLHEKNVKHEKHEAYSKQFEADHSIFGWTHGEQVEGGH